MEHLKESKVFDLGCIISQHPGGASHFKVYIKRVMSYDINSSFSPRFGCWPYDTIRLLGELGYPFSRCFSMIFVGNHLQLP